MKEEIFIKRSSKIFLKSFACSALAILLVASVFILSQMGEIASQNSSWQQPNLKIPQKSGDKFTVLLTISKDETLPPHSFFLLCFDALNGKIYVLRLPSECIVSKRDEARIILKEAFYKNSSSALRAVSDFFKIKVSRYISFTDSSFISLIDHFSPISFEVRENMSEVDRKNDIYIKIDKGRRLFGGSLMLDFFTYTRWKKGKAAALSESAILLGELLNQNGAELLVAEQLILQNAKTNLSALDFESRRDALSYLLSLDKVAEGVNILGEYQLGDTQFTLTEASKTKISALF